MTKLLALFTLLHLVVVPATLKQTVTIKGSDTMVILVQRWSEIYGTKNTNIQFQVTGGGSGTGISALLNGTTDICSSSRPIKPSEVSQLKNKYKSKGVEVAVARDGISVYVHKNNPVTKLTVEQLRDIFLGKIKNWKQVGGRDAKIVLYSRENNSGTYEFFKEHVLNKQDFAAEAQHMVGTGALVNAIRKDPNGIGYGGIAYAEGVKDIGLAGAAGGRYVEPTEDNVLNGTYPLSRFLYFYLRERPTGQVKAFIDWILSSEGQKVVNEVGYIPVKKY
jgi:phosphate transport system substrate-binding protein